MHGSDHVKLSFHNQGWQSYSLMHHKLPTSWQFIGRQSMVSPTYIISLFQMVLAVPADSPFEVTSVKHRKNCECCPVSQLIVEKQRLS